MSGVLAAIAALTQLPASAQPQIPAKPPIGGPLWTVAVPAALLAISIIGTWLLYRHFAGEK